jgi:F-type H+-transporting ATPase subunit delta
MADVSEKSAFAEPTDIGAQSIAAAYAKALFGAAEKAGAVDEVLGQLNSLLDDVAKKHPKMLEVLGSGMFDEEQKYAMIERAFAKRAHPLITNFLKVLAKHSRSPVLPSIREELRKLNDKAKHRIPVLVTSAAPLGDAQKNAVAARMKTVLGGDPVLQTEVDPSLIGGLVVQVGDVVFDGSLSANLGRLREQLINRSVHEIQRRRDRVRTTS